MRLVAVIWSLLLYLANFIALLASHTLAQPSDAKTNAASQDDQQEHGFKYKPLVSCAPDAIYVEFKTLNRFHGRAYVNGNGHDVDKPCFRKLVTVNQVELLIPHLDCRAQRLRTFHPPGLQISIDVIISFHMHFLTSADRKLRVTCIHTQNSSIEQSKLPDNSLQGAQINNEQLPLPLPLTCSYTVHRGNSAEAPIVRYAAIGERLYHSWQCDPGVDLAITYCLFITACFVSEQSSGRRQRLSDASGCSTDPLLPFQIVYNRTDLSAGAIVPAFSFSDRTQLYFQCQVHLIRRNFPNQPCIDAQCSKRLIEGVQSRSRRDLATFFRESNAHQLLGDTASQRISLLDLEDSLSDLPNTICPNYGNRLQVKRALPPGSVCVSRAAFAIVVGSTFVVAVCTLAVVVGVLCKRTDLSANMYQ